MLQLSTVRHRKGKPQQQQGKGNAILCFCSIPIALLTLLHHTGWVAKLYSFKGTGFYNEEISLLLSD